jgi:hypothetical protein
MKTKEANKYTNEILCKTPTHLIFPKSKLGQSHKKSPTKYIFKDLQKIFFNIVFLEILFSTFLDRESTIETPTINRKVGKI